MKLILFIHQDAFHQGEPMKKIIEGAFENLKIETLRTLNAFNERLKQVSGYDNEIFILFADSRMRLVELISLIDLMEGKRLVIVLPDDSETTLSMAHQFFPRYFTYINDTYNDLCAVIGKMAKMKNNRPMEEMLNGSPG